MIQIIDVREHPEWIDRAADYFSSQGSASRQAWLESMGDSISNDNALPRWFLVLREGKIAGGYSLTYDDSMMEKGSGPWLRALHVEPEEEKELASKLLAAARLSAAELGFDKAYLHGDHTDHYEKQGWRYVGDVLLDGGGKRQVYQADTPLIETARLRLRPFRNSDAAAVISFLKEEFSTTKAALEWIHWQRDRWDMRKPFVVFCIELKETGQCIGRVYFHSKAELGGEVEIGYGIAEEYRCNGYATEAAKAAVWFAFEKAEQNVICAIVKGENIASRRVIEKAGFVYSNVRSVIDDDGADVLFDYFQMCHIDYLPGPEWDIASLYRPESMDAFFNARADGYDDHMLRQNGIEDYRRLGDCFPATENEIAILDIGCGTGIELDYIWEKAPKAHITCVDVSRGMLELLLYNHPLSHQRISVVEASYLDWAYPEAAFDIATSNMTMHHFWEEEKIGVYKKIADALKPGGIYIEGDFIVNAILAKQYKQRYERIIGSMPDNPKAGEYHIDIPFTIETQKRLLHSAGFSRVEVLAVDTNHGKGAILKASK